MIWLVVVVFFPVEQLVSGYGLGTAFSPWRALGVQSRHRHRLFCCAPKAPAPIGSSGWRWSGMGKRVTRKAIKMSTKCLGRIFMDVLHAPDSRTGSVGRSVDWLAVWLVGGLRSKRTRSAHAHGQELIFNLSRTEGRCIGHTRLHGACMRCRRDPINNANATVNQRTRSFQELLTTQQTESRHFRV